MSPRRYVKHIVLHWLPLILWMGWIYYLSEQPSLPNLGRGMGVSDDLFNYSAHVLISGILTWLLWRVLSIYTRASPAINGAGLLATLFAAGDEIHQFFTVGRDARLEDGAANLAGILLVVALLYLWQRKTRKSEI